MDAAGALATTAIGGELGLGLGLRVAQTLTRRDRYSTYRNGCTLYPFPKQPLSVPRLFLQEKRKALVEDRLGPQPWSEESSYADVPETLPPINALRLGDGMRVGTA